jgi:hypothetical protein
MVVAANEPVVVVVSALDLLSTSCGLPASPKPRLNTVVVPV